MTTKQLALIIGAILCIASNPYASNSNTPMPLPFTKNMGQWPDSILFRASANGATMWFTKNGIWYQFFRRVEKSDASASALGGPPSGWVPVNDLSVGGPAFGGVPVNDLLGKFNTQPDSIETTMIKAEFVGASESVEVVGLEELEYKCNYFIGNEPDEWRTDVPNYSAVTMRGLYPGVDVIFASHEGRLQSEITAASSADLALVKVDYRGAEGITQKTSRSALVQTSFGEHTFEGILLSDGSASKSERQVASTSSSASGVGLEYSTYLGGSLDDWIWGIAVDAKGSVYVTGRTESANFPTQNAYRTFNSGSFDVNITKLNNIGNGLVFSTYVGGSNWDEGMGIAVDTVGNSYVTGRTLSTNFPTSNPFQSSNSGASWDVFVTKLGNTGNLLNYSTYLGDVSQDRGYGISVDLSGNAYITGLTSSSNFPTRSPFQNSYGGNVDVFVTKFNNTGNSLIYSSYLGGSNSEIGFDIAVDAEGCAYITGFTQSSDFLIQNPFQTIIGSLNSYDAFVTKLNSVGSALVYSTYLGGSDHDQGEGIAVDSGGNAYITGFTNSADFPTLNPFQSSFGGGEYDAFVTKLDSVGSGLFYSTYLGGDGSDVGFGIATDVGRSSSVTGYTQSANFPIENPFQTSYRNPSDAFVTKFNSLGNGLFFSTYLGGSSYDYGYSITVDKLGSTYIGGYTTSLDLPVLNPVQSISGGGLYDALVAKFDVFCCLGSRGNVDGDVGQVVSVGDVIFFAQYLFAGGSSLPCKEEADTDENNKINLIDIMKLVNYFFQSGPGLPSCP